jgi:hypothetical protein
MACSACGFSRSGNPERLANKPPYEAKPRHEANPRYENKPHHYDSSSPRYAAAPSRYDDRYRGGDYYGPSMVEQERSSHPQHTPVVRWKRSKVPGRGNRESG